MTEEADQGAVQLVPIGVAARYVGVTPNTLRRWETEGLIKPKRTPGGTRRYRLADLDDLLARRAS